MPENLFRPAHGERRPRFCQGLLRLQETWPTDSRHFARKKSRMKEEFNFSRSSRITTTSCFLIRWVHLFLYYTQFLLSFSVFTNCLGFYLSLCLRLIIFLLYSIGFLSRRRLVSNILKFSRVLRDLWWSKTPRQVQNINRRCINKLFVSSIKESLNYKPSCIVMWLERNFEFDIITFENFMYLLH